MEIKEREMQLKKTLELTKANLSKLNGKAEASRGDSASSSTSPGSAKSETVRKEDLSAYV